MIGFVLGILTGFVVTVMFLTIVILVALQRGLR